MYLTAPRILRSLHFNAGFRNFLISFFDTCKNHYIFRNYNQKNSARHYGLGYTSAANYMGRIVALFRTHHFNVVIFESYSTEIKK